MTTLSANQKWIDDFVIELRLRGVGGAAIGDAAAAAESHATEAGESLPDAFGDPRTYARNLEFSPDAMATTLVRDWAAVLAPVACGLIALWLGPTTAKAARVGSEVPVTWGNLTEAVVLTLGVVLLAKALRAVVDHLVIAALMMGGIVAVAVASGALITARAFELPIWVAAALTAALLIASVALERRSESAAEDRVIDPLTGTGRFDDDTHTSRWTERAYRYQVWFFPIATIGLSALVWFLA
ncbi:Uncharacterised protein [Dermatophilus congolensis]|uniref:Uncharacterized protein n=1 Tax=Dermatophilus congolensis TaxID=1863 RepID=A0AA46H1B3_9MICO|nr:hypothetical protein [Dermatophilus congolensis]STD14324.1 Uncharacterised protein [Dermatophilus congolensis]